MITASIIAIAILFTFLAVLVSLLTRKETDRTVSMMLHGIAIIPWIILGYLLYNSTWPAGNSYYPTAGMLLGAIVVIFHTVCILLPYLNRRDTNRSHDDIQKEYREMVAKLTQRKKKAWYL